MTEVEIRGVSKRYTETPILRGVDLDIHAGELFFLLGPSGCGKSTLLRILAGLVEADAGTIRFDGEDILGLPPEKRRTAMVFQNYALWPHLSVFENVAFSPRNSKLKKAEISRIVTDALEVVEMSDFAQRKPPSLSGGQQQRVALARALAADPRLLLLDEPLSNLDARLRDAMRGKIKAICKSRELTALYVTHDRQEALSMADRLGVMHQGVIRRLGTPEEVYNHPGDCFTAKFLGDVNFIPGELKAGGVFACALGNLPVVSEFPPGRAVGAIRPERIRFAAPGERGISARLVGRSFYGENCEWEFYAPGDVRLVVREGAPPQRRIGENYELTFEPGFFMALPEEADE